MRGTLVAALVVLTCAPAHAQWQAVTGPPGGTVCAVAIDPLDADSVYAGGRLLWHSSDGGTTWAHVENVPLQLGDLISAIAISRDKDGPILASASRLLVSHDRGATWAVSEASGATLGSVQHGGIQFGPAGSGVVYCAGGNKTIHRSTDNGTTWARLDTVPKEVRYILHFTADRFDAETISFMCYTEDKKTYWVLSRDGGASSENISFPEGESRVVSLSIDPDDNSLLYLCTQTYAWGRGYGQRYFYSYDDGASWEPLWDPETDRVPGPATRRKLERVFPDVIPTPLPAGEHAALDRRELTWSEDKPGRVIRMSEGRVFRSDDFGKSWAPSDEGLTATCVQRIAFDPHDPKAAYCAAHNSLWRTADEGKTWSTMLVHERIKAMTFSPDGKHLLLAASGNGEHIQRGSSQGQNWQRVWGTRNSKEGVFVLSSYEATSETGAAQHVCVAVGIGFRLESTDEGASWHKAGETNFGQQGYGPMRPFAQRVVRGVDLWLADNGRRRILSSTDQGKAWELYAPTKDWKLYDWAFAADGALWTIHIPIDPHARERWRKISVISGTEDSTRTFDLPNDMNAMALACDPKDAAVVYVAFDDGRILRTTDSGKRFTLLEGGPRGLRVPCLAVSPHDGALWVGTDGNGVWILDNPKRAEAGPVKREH